MSSILALVGLGVVISVLASVVVWYSQLDTFDKVLLLGLAAAGAWAYGKLRARLIESDDESVEVVELPPESEA